VKKTDYGRKHSCVECACKYDDLKQKSPACPQCGAAAPEPKLKSVPRR